MSDHLNIKPELLRWAQERSGLPVSDLIKSFPRYELWLEGKTGPTMKQLEAFAHKTHAPLGYFFLATPPQEVLPINDFRTVSNEGVIRPSANLLDTIHGTQIRHDWMRDFLIEQGEEPLPFIGSRTIKDDPKDVASDMRAALGLKSHWTCEFNTWEDALRELIQAIESSGIMVMINGIVDNSTNRPLDVDEFRGFVICDEYAPTIFLNGVDAKSAQMFTLAHELVHLWIGQSGIPEIDAGIADVNTIEAFCNRTAVEFLIPEDEIVAAWGKTKDAKRPIYELATMFRVSPIVVGRRLLDLTLINQAAYYQFYREHKNLLAIIEARKKKGGNFYTNVGARLGKRFPAAVYSAAKEGKLDYRDAYRLTGLSGETYDRFGTKHGFPL